MELKRSNLVLPTSGYELDREEMSYVEGGDFFVGINMSASLCYSISSFVPMSAKTGGIGMGTLFSIAMGIPQVSAIVTPIISSVSTALASIPVVGWIAIIAFGLGVAAALGAAIVAGNMGKGYKFGVNVKTGWLGIPTGCSFVCQFT
jgi:hypothetical protein